MANISILKKYLPWGEDEDRYTLEEIVISMLLQIEKNHLDRCLMHADTFLERIGYSRPKKEDYQWLDQIINNLCKRDCDDDYIFVSNNGEPVETKPKNSIGVEVEYRFYKSADGYISVRAIDVENIREICKENKFDFFTAVGVYMAICECSQWYKGFTNEGECVGGYIGFVSKANIAIKLNKSETTINRYINMLESAKIIGVHHSDAWKSTNCYAIPCDDYLIDMSVKRMKNAQKEMEENSKESTKGITFGYHKKKYGGVC